MKTIKTGVDTFFTLPDGYIFKDENGNVINATKIVLEKKKKEYPKTYDECCKVLNVAVRDLDILENMLDTSEIIYRKNLDRLLNSFRKLLICRDAYWKIAGEEMGLGKPWEPDWDTSEPKYVIACTSNGVEKQWETTYCKCFAFPTEEMQDAFKENFDPDIAYCKELLYWYYKTTRLMETTYASAKKNLRSGETTIKMKRTQEVAVACKENIDFTSLVRKMREAQQDIEMMERLAYKWTVDDHFKYDIFLKDKTRLESEVDEYLKKMEE